MLTVNSSKTFDEILVEQPNLYDGVAGYTWSTSENKWVNTGISEVCKAQIEDWFGLRKVCDDDKFARFFRRKLNITALRYAQQLRIELSAFDPLVAEYIERENLSNNSKQSAGSIDKTSSNTKESKDGRTEVRTPDLTEVIDRDTSGTHANEEGGSDELTRDTSHQSANGGSDNTHTVGEGHNNSKEASKAAPQSIAYQGATAGELPDFDWSYISAQAQSEGDNNTTTDSTTTYGSTATGSDNSSEVTKYGKTVSGNEHGTEDMTRKESGTESRVSSSTGSSTEAGTEGVESSQTESASGKQHEVYTGRHGLTPQAAFQSAISYIKTVSSFEWLKTELEECFLSVYDI